jgi:hypothetical protein
MPLPEHLADTASNPHPFELSEFIPTWQKRLRSWRAWMCTQTRQTLQQVCSAMPRARTHTRTQRTHISTDPYASNCCRSACTCMATRRCSRVCLTRSWAACQTRCRSVARPCAFQCYPSAPAPRAQRPSDERPAQVRLLPHRERGGRRGQEGHVHPPRVHRAPGQRILRPRDVPRHPPRPDPPCATEAFPVGSPYLCWPASAPDSVGCTCVLAKARRSRRWRRSPPPRRSSSRR